MGFTPELIYKRWFDWQKDEIRYPYDLEYENLEGENQWVHEDKRREFYFLGRWGAGVIGPEPGRLVGLNIRDKDGKIKVITREGPREKT